MKKKVMFGLSLLTIVGLLATVTVQAPIGPRQEPLTVSNFRVEIDGIASASFASVDGLRCETEVIEYREGGDTNFVRLIPGATKCGPLVLQRGLTANRELWNWYQEVANGRDVRKNIAVVLMNPDRTDAVRYNLYECFPVKWTGPTLDAKGSDIAIEEVVIAFERMEWAP